MKLEEAVDLIKHDLKIGKQAWADLGAGTGIFTSALANILPSGSIIYAVDKDRSSLGKISSPDNQTEIKKLYKNFIDEELPTNLDGILWEIHFIL